MQKLKSLPSRQEIWKMFDQISSTYDKVNTAMTFGLHQRWRKKISSFLPQKEALTLLDLATGTADQIIALMETTPSITSITGIDLAEEMLKIGKQKIALKPYASKVSLQVASALEIPFPENTFDAITISFGIRNFTDVPLALKEARRVLKPEGKLLILEGSLPSNLVLQKLHVLYLRYALPTLGALLSSDKKAYKYLNETIETFPSGKAFLKLLKDAGFQEANAHPLLGGIVSIYSGNKHVSS